jgi:hypothetical protein
MAQGGTVEIEVELTGTKDIREGLGSIGEAGKSLVDSMHFSNEKLGEGIGQLGESVFGLKDSFSELSTGIKSLGTTGASGFMALLGPIGAVVTAGMALYEVFKLISGAALEAEQNEAAMAAAASDLQSKLEALSEKGVVLATKDLQKFSKETLLAQVAKEKLQFAQEKLTKQTQKAIEAEQNLAKVKKTVAKLEKEGGMSVHALTYARRELKQATKDLATAEKDLTQAISKTLDEQKRVSKQLVDNEKLYIGHEETSAEFLKTKIKENVETLKSLQIMQKQIKLSEDRVKIAEIEIEKEAKLALVKAKKNEEDQKALLQQNKDLEKRIKAIDQVALAEQLAVKKTEKVNEEIEEKRKARFKARRERAKSMARQREAEAQKEERRRLQAIAENARIEALKVQGEQDSLSKSIKLAEIRYKASLELAQNERQTQIATLEFSNQQQQLIAQQEQKRIEKAKAQEEERRAFMRESQLFDIERIEDQTERELAMLDFKYQQMFEMHRGNEERINELTRRYSMEREDILGRETEEMAGRFNDLFTSFGQGMAEAAAGALVMGESFKASVVQVLQSLAKTAAVEALMETARGIAALFINPAGAANHFAAAAAFGVAAGAAGGAAGALGGGGGGGASGGGGRVSPSGSPQTASTPMREEATQTSMVFNVNFSGAVVYDTKRAAEQALADRITRVMNQNRRGTPRR